MVLSGIHQQGPRLGYSLDKNEGFREWCHPPASVPSSFLLVDSWPYLPYGLGSGTHDLTHLISTQTCVALAFQVWGLSCLVHTHFLLVTCNLWWGPPVVSSFFQLCTDSAWGLPSVPWVSMRNDEWLYYSITSLKVHNALIIANIVSCLKLKWQNIHVFGQWKQLLIYWYIYENLYRNREISRLLIGQELQWMRA